MRAKPPPPSPLADLLEQALFASEGAVVDALFEIGKALRELAAEQRALREALEEQNEADTPPQTPPQAPSGPRLTLLRAAEDHEK